MLERKAASILMGCECSTNLARLSNLQRGSLDSQAAILLRCGIGVVQNTFILVSTWTFSDSQLTFLYNEAAVDFHCTILYVVKSGMTMMYSCCYLRWLIY